MSWYTIPGVDQDVVLHTRVHVFRNLHGLPFPAHMKADESAALIENVGNILSGNGFHKIDFTDISHTAAYAYAEQQYISPRFVRQSLLHALYLNEPCNLSVSLCDDDHIRICGLMPGCALRDAFNSAYKIEGLLDTHFDFAFDDRLGYLTQHPSDVGLGMGMSVMLALPALCLSGLMPSLIKHLHPIGLSVHPLCQEADHALGFLYHVSLSSGSGVDEQTVCSHMGKAIQQIIDAERTKRKTLPPELTEQLMDEAARSKGILNSARSLSVKEFIQRSSYMRLGIALGWIDDIHIETLNSLLIEVMPATLTMSSETPPQGQSEQDKLRATVVRERLSV